LFTQANTYSPLLCGAGLAVAELAVLLYPALVLSPKLTDFTKTAPEAIPARATTAMVRVLDFMIILSFRSRHVSVRTARRHGATRHREYPRRMRHRGARYQGSCAPSEPGTTRPGKSAGKSAGSTRGTPPAGMAAFMQSGRPGAGSAGPLQVSFMLAG
jgi:hypothetical protein